MNINKAIKIKEQWRKDNYPPPLADEINADNLSIEALKGIKRARNTIRPYREALLPGETKD